MKRIQRVPKTLCVQQQSCAPMVSAFAEGSAAIEERHVVPKPKGIAEAILRGDPTRAYPYIRHLTLESGGGMVAVSETEIREARRLLEEMEGILACFSSSTAVAGIIKLARQGAFPLRETVLINLTGADRNGTGPKSNVNWLTRVDGNWQEDAPPI